VAILTNAGVAGFDMINLADHFGKGRRGRQVDGPPGLVKHAMSHYRLRDG
jgi:hypothetical protein